MKTVIIIGFWFLVIIDDTLQKKVNCTACGKQVNQFQRNSMYEHPALKVLICRVGKCECTIYMLITPKLLVRINFLFCVFSLSYLDLLVITNVTSSSSPATSITQVMISTETLMGWMSSAGTKVKIKPLQCFCLFVSMARRPRQDKSSYLLTSSKCMDVLFYLLLFYL